MATTDQQGITDALASFAQSFEATLERRLPTRESVNPVLAEAMNYAVVGGGKRVRAFLVTRACELCGGSAEESEPAAVAIECIHAFSLVHDDLPAMDDDDLRRGRPTCHRAFGEAVAILAGDGLNTLAFEILATQTKDPERAVAAVAELANATGWAGMIGGQTTDILSETKPTQLELVEEIHRYKTARLIECAARLGAIAAGASREQQEALGLYGRHLGLAFQIADDLLDVTGTQEQMGKSVSKDAGAGKQTYPAAVGMDASREMAGRVAQQAIDSLADFGTEADDLRHLVRFVIERKN